MLETGAGNRSVDKDKYEWSSKQSTQRYDAKESVRVRRKFINSAIYVEKPLSSTNSNESTSISVKISNEDILENKTKRCSCSVDQKICPCHFDTPFANTPKDEKRNIVTSKILENKIKISQNCKSSNNIDEGKDLFLRKWAAKKDEERRKKESETRKAQEVKIKEKQMQLEQKRNDFKKWLMDKKKIEMEAKKKKQKELEEQQIKELEREKRQLENQLKFQLWLKKKEEAILEKKIEKQTKLINELEHKEMKLKENEKAFNDWLKNSKNRQKPIPLNRGLETLCSSSSVTYINPNPWNPVP